MISIGPRLWKTGLAVALTVFLVRLTGHHYEVYGAVAAALAVAPSASRSVRTISNQILAHLIGGLVGALAILLFGPGPVVIGSAVILVLLVVQRFRLKEMAPTLLTVTLFVMAPHSDSVTTYVAWRLLSVLIGSLVGTLVNALVLPPDYHRVTITAMDRAGAALDSFILSIAGRLEHPAAIEKAEILAGAARVEAEISEARRLCMLMGESQRSPQIRRQKEVIDRAIKVLASLLERIQIIHKAALVAEQSSEYQTQLQEMQAALAELVGRRRALFATLFSHDSGQSLPLVLADLEQRFEAPSSLPVCEEEVEPFFRLYRMRSSISYMANRLGRLYVAKEAAGARLEEAAGARPEEAAGARPEEAAGARPEEAAGARPEEAAGARPGSITRAMHRLFVVLQRANSPTRSAPSRFAGFPGRTPCNIGRSHEIGQGSLLCSSQNPCGAPVPQTPARTWGPPGLALSDSAGQSG